MARWSDLGRSLARLCLVDAQGVEIADIPWCFGRQFRNTDMHLGNLGFESNGSRFTVAPACDMLPMHYAPLAGGEVPPRAFDVPLPG